MPGLVGSVDADQRVAEQIDIADRVEHFVFDEFVVVAQPFAVEHARLVENDRVLQAATKPEPRGAHCLEVGHETEGAGAADFLGVGVLREIDHHVPVLGAEHRMRKIDREIELEAVVWLEARPLVVNSDLNRLLDAQIALARRLLLDSG